MFNPRTGRAKGGRHMTSYDVIAPWPDMTRSLFFYQNLRKVCPMENAKSLRAPPNGLGAIAKNSDGVHHNASTPCRCNGQGFRWALSIARFPTKASISDREASSKLYAAYSTTEQNLPLANRETITTYKSNISSSNGRNYPMSCNSKLLFLDPEHRNDKGQLWTGTLVASLQ